MKIVKAEAFMLDNTDGEKILKKLEACGRTCYKSTPTDDPLGSAKLVRMLIRRGHESVLEHVSVTCKFICNRGVSHEIVRHRLASYSQESTRYCNYRSWMHGGEITVIDPKALELDDRQTDIWLRACMDAERRYFDMLEAGCTPEMARDVLPNALKTEVVMTANLREWRHFFRLRCAQASHPQMREVANLLFKRMRDKIPGVFEDIDF